MDSVFDELWSARQTSNGELLAKTLASEPSTNNPDRLRSFLNDANHHSVESEIRTRITKRRKNQKCNAQEANGWIAIYVAYWKALAEIAAVHDGKRKSSWSTVYEAWKELVLHVSRGFSNFGVEIWALPVLYSTAKTLRTFAIRADDERNRNQTENTASFGDDFDTEAEENQQLEDCARQLNKLFTLCLNDRADLEVSRKWGIYYIINLLFKTYFRLNSASLSRNILKALKAYKGDMPDLYQFPVAWVVTFQYYEGVLEFLEENYPKAEKHLTEAFYMCHKDALGNKERILMYLIPCHLLTTHTLPSPSLLAPYPNLQRLFLPLSQAIKKGDLKGFDDALRSCEEEFVRRRIYLTLERGRDIALRNLFRKVFVAGGFDEPKEEGAKPIRRTRVPLTEFQAAVSIGSGGSVDSDEVECLLANMIFKNLMKGYIARDRGFVVLSKAGAFPGTGV